jgi:hypothetical protein
MEGYLGSFAVDVKDTGFKDFTPADWALYYIGSYGQIDGAHHKQWVLDQVARILNGAPVTVTERRWSNGHKELDAHVGTSAEYEDWVLEMQGEYDEEDEMYEYDYDTGIAP